MRAREKRTRAKSAQYTRRGSRAPESNASGAVVVLFLVRFYEISRRSVVRDVLLKRSTSTLVRIYLVDVNADISNARKFGAEGNS